MLFCSAFCLVAWLFAVCVCVRVFGGLSSCLALYTYDCLFVCMLVRFHVWKYVCMYACMHACMHVSCLCMSMRNYAHMFVQVYRYVQY